MRMTGFKCPGKVICWLFAVHALSFLKARSVREREGGVLASEARHCWATICNDLNRVDRKQGNLTDDKLCLC